MIAGRIRFSFIICSVLIAVLPARLSLARQPDAAPAPMIRTEGDFLREYNDFLASHLLPIFDKAHPDPTPDDIAARKFIVGLAPWHAAVWDKAPAKRDVVMGTHDLIQKNKYEDPILLLTAGYYLVLWNDHTLAARRLRAAANSIPRTRDTAVARMLLFEQLAIAAAKRDDQFAQLGAAREGITAVFDAVREGAFKENPRFLVRMILDVIDEDAWPPAELARLCDGLDGMDDVDPWLKQVLRGLAEKELAWASRGSGWAYKVTDEGWKGYETHLAKAREHLVKAYELDPRRPEAAMTMIQVVMGGCGTPGETERTWFDRASSVEFGIWRAHAALRLALRPRWGGTLKDMYAFGKECAASTRFDTCVPYSFVLTLMDMGEESEDLRTVMKIPGAIDNARRILNTYLETPEGDIGSGTIHSDLTLLNWAAGDYAAARKHRDKHGALHTFLELSDCGVPLTPIDLSDEIYLLSSPVAKEVAEGDKAMSRDDFARASSLFTKAAEQLPTLEAPVAEALRRRIELARITYAIRSKQECKFNFVTGTPGWVVYFGSWIPTPEGGIRMTAKDNTPLIRCKIDIGDRYEVSTHIDFGIRPIASLTSGIVVGITEEQDGAQAHAVAIRVEPGNSRSLQIGCCDFARPNQPFQKELPSKPAYDLTVKVWDKQLVAFVDGEFVFAGRVAVEDDELIWGPRFGLGVFGRGANSSSTFSNVRVKPLTERPVELDKPQILRP